jgi:hypothetical protein
VSYCISTYVHEGKRIKEAFQSLTTLTKEKIKKCPTQFFVNEDKRNEMTLQMRGMQGSHSSMMRIS